MVNSELFNHSRYVTYRVKDGIVDFFKDRYGADKRPGVRLQEADVMINVHIDGNRVTLSLDSSGESLHKRGYRVAQTGHPSMKCLPQVSCSKRDTTATCRLLTRCVARHIPYRAALIAANINPGVYRRNFALRAVERLRRGTL